MQQKARNSAFELLRIISMVLIVMHHYSEHGEFDFMLPFNMKLYYVQCLRMGGKLGVNLFVLISGYFLCKSEKINLLKIFKLEICVIFYSVLIGLLFFCFQPDKESLRELLQEFTPIRSQRYGFYTTYFAMILFSPFLNKLVYYFKKDELKRLLLLILIIWVVIPVIPTFYAIRMSELGWFFFLYLSAAYIRLYGNDLCMCAKKYFLISIGCYALVLLSVLMFDFLGARNMIFQKKFTYFLPMNSILIFSASIMLFIVFTKLNINNNKFINIISSATFGIYLIHENHLLRHFIWVDLFRNSQFINSNFIYLHSIIAISSVYIAGTLIELIRKYVLERPLFIIIKKIIPDSLLVSGENDYFVFFAGPEHKEQN